MVTAKELLSSVETENHIVIGNDRFIIVPAALKRIAVQYDHNIETVTFDCPRFWDDHDMSKMAVYINYMLSNGYHDSYPAKNVVVDGDIMHFDWTISANVTQIAGDVSFLVCVKKVDAEGNEENHWNSELCQDMHVSKGLECEEEALEMQPDLVTELLLRMNSVEQINIQANEMQAIYDATVEVANEVEEIKNQALDASGHIRNAYANAIKSKLSGSVICVDDVSPVEHNPYIWVHGKNLLNIPDTVVEGSHGWCNKQFGPFELDPGTYTISVDFLQQGTDTSRVTVSARKYEAITTSLGGATSEEVSGRLKLTFTIPADEKGFTLVAYSNITANALETSCAFSNFQIEKGTVATEYVPFIDATTVELTRCGKAIFSKSSQTVSGVSKPWASLLVAAVKVPPGNYVVSCRFNQIGPDISTVSVSTRSYNDYTVPFGDVSSSEKSGYLVKAFTVPEGAGGFQIFLYSNTPNTALTTECSFENICVEAGSVATGYEVYNGAKYTPAANGIVSGVTSLSPNMTLLTDTEGVVIECEYNSDTKTYLENCFRPTNEQVQASVDTWLSANFTSAEGVGF